MKNTILRYGIYSAISICLLALLSWFLGKKLDYSIQEIIGYAGIIVSLLFVFFGIKHYRDKENNGLVSFGKAFLIGILITLFASLAFGLLDIVYNKLINPDFVSEYYAHYAEKMKSSLPPSEFQIKLKELEAQKELFSNAYMSFLLMAVTVFIIGFIISLISAFILQRKPE
ncbi:DUF4199 domain-containing protein [Aquimarina sediminis]|uniref:DUF4199 domain-containing protein n=1 Tax=Aquimarina sediminis TaxID=2070536 RepID=UPI000CA0309E|nr:DUF4199 domain-containing protein [Aquimarina sediminis]